MARSRSHRQDSRYVGTRGTSLDVDSGQTTAQTLSMAFPPPYRSGETRSFGQRDIRSTDQTSDRRGLESKRILFPRISCTQESRGVETNLRSFTSQSFPDRAKIQDGICTHDPTIAITGQVGNKHRYQRCLPTRADTPQFEEIPQARVSRSGIPVQGATIRGGHSTIRIHPYHQVVGSQFPIEGDSFPPLHRRLADRSRFSTTDSGSCLLRDQACSPIRLDTKLGQVAPHSHSTVRVHRSVVQPRGGDCCPTTTEDRENKSSHRPTATSQSDNSTSIIIPDRSVGIRRKASSVREVLSSSHTVVSSPTVAYIDRPTRSPGVNGRSGEGGTSLVAQPIQHGQGDATQRLHSRQQAFHRCIRASLGSSSGRDGAVGEVDTFRQTVSHQCPRAEGGDTCLRSLGQSISDRHQMVDIYRQHDCSSTYQQAGGDEVPRPLLGGRGVDQSSVDARASDQGQTSAGQTQRFGRRTFTSGPNTRYRVESVTTNIPDNMWGIRDTEHRSVRNVSQCQTARLLLTPSRGRSPGYGLHGDQLGRDARLRISPDRLPDRSATQDSPVRLPSVTHSTQLSNTAVVSPANEPARRHSQSAATTKQTTQAARQRYFPRFRRGIVPTRVDAIQRSFQEAGFPGDVSRHLSRKNRDSSTRTYEAKWRVFVRWCDGRQIDPFAAPLNDVLSFFCYLFDRLQLKPVTIEGYRAMLNPIYRSRGIELSSRSVVPDLLASFRTQRPRQAPQAT